VHHVRRQQQAVVHSSSSSSKVCLKQALLLLQQRLHLCKQPRRQVGSASPCLEQQQQQPPLLVGMCSNRQLMHTRLSHRSNSGSSSSMMLITAGCMLHMHQPQQLQLLQNAEVMLDGLACQTQEFRAARLQRLKQQQQQQQHQHQHQLKMQGGCACHCQAALLVLLCRLLHQLLQQLWQDLLLLIWLQAVKGVQGWLNSKQVVVGGSVCLLQLLHWKVQQTKLHSHQYSKNSSSCSQQLTTGK
jgi:hypothetical protein